MNRMFQQLPQEVLDHDFMALLDIHDRQSMRQTSRALRNAVPHAPVLVTCSISRNARAYLDPITRSASATGNLNHGGDASPVQGQLQNVQSITASTYAFAALRADGSVIAWGRPNFGGDASQVQAQLQNVQQVSA